MTPARWQVVTKIFEAALEKPQAEREVYVQQACSEDVELHFEVIRLLKADVGAGSFLEGPAVSPFASPEDVPSSFSLLATGSIVSERFKIQRFIGQGGMGQVYEALDLELNSRVALKAIRPELSSDLRALSRFRREVNLTRLITHPNICRTFDIDRHCGAESDKVKSDITFLTMELLEGETLAALLRREGRLRAAQAKPLILQMIAALQAAHAVGVVHRDFKPSNVLLVPGLECSRVVVTDFGLARAIQAYGENSHELLANSLTGSQGLLGTLVYMAPEQFERGEASIATDIYALGLVMFEMVTGQRPFFDPIPFAEAVKRLKQPAPSAQPLVPELEPLWDEVLTRCLEIQPSDRFDSALGVAEGLMSAGPRQIPLDAPSAERAGQTGSRRADVAQLPPKASAPIRPGFGARWRKPLAALALLTALVALSAEFLRHYLWRATIPDGSSILVTDIANQTSEEELNATTDILLHELSQSAYFNVMERSKVRTVLQQMARPYQQQLDPEMAREVAWRAGGTMVVFGSVTRVGPEYSLDLRIERLGKSPQTSPRGWHKSFEANDRQELFHAIQAGSQWIRQMAGEHERSFANEKPPQDTTTSSWEALLFYSQAEQLKALDHTPEAIERLERAVAADPDFALAWMRLGDLSLAIEKDGEAFRFWNKALGSMRKRPLTKREELRIKGLYASDTGDFSTAQQIFQEWEVLYPKDYLPSFYLAGALRGAGRYLEAVEKLDETERKQPAAWYVVAQRSHYNLAMGRYDSVRRDMKRLHELGENEMVEMLQVSLDFIQGDYEKALALSEALGGSTDGYWKSLSFSIIASVLSEMGRYQEARSFLVRGAEFDAATGRLGSLADKKIELAYVLFRTGDREGCGEASRAAMKAEDGPLHLKSAGSLLARCGFLSEAEELVDELKSMPNAPIFQIAQHRTEGEVLLANGNVDAAVREFRAEASLEDSYRPKEYLARSLVVGGQQEDAMRLYREIVDSPGQIWQEPDMEMPGLWGDALFQCGRIDRTLHNRRDDLLRFTRLREHADPALQELKLANELLERPPQRQVLQSIQ